MIIKFIKSASSQMSLSEAIKHAKEKADELGCSPCAKQHRQLAEWLQELMDFKESGRSIEKGIGEDDVDPEELKMGTDVEMEHTSNKSIARKIALDHLSEGDSKYYTHLKEMEKKYNVKD